jgi:hypothetical protein
MGRRAQRSASRSTARSASTTTKMRGCPPALPTRAWCARSGAPSPTSARWDLRRWFSTRAPSTAPPQALLDRRCCPVRSAVAAAVHCARLAAAHCTVHAAPVATVVCARHAADRSFSTDHARAVDPARPACHGHRSPPWQTPDFSWRSNARRAY